MNQYQYITPNNPDDWRKVLWDALCVTVLFIISVALCALVGSCTAHKDVERTDTLIITRYDTVRTTEVKEKNTTQYIDRWRDRLYVVNTLTGDTTKQVIKENVLIAFSQEQHDSIDRYRAKCDSLMNIIKRNTLLTKEKPLNRWQQFKIDTYMYIFISLLATMITWIVSIYLYRKNKKP